MPFMLGCAQFAPVKADVKANLDTIARVVVQGAGEGVDLLLFPEAAVSGYFLEGGVADCALAPEALVGELASRVGSIAPIDVAVGFYSVETGNLYNSCAYMELGPSPRLVATYHKFFLPTYGVFDEERFVSRGREIGIVDTRFGKFGILICEDVWHSILPTLCAVAGATLMLVPSASPARGFGGEKPENLIRYERMLRAIAEEHGVWCANCQLCGFEGGKGFPGGSMVYDPFGRPVAEAPLHEPHLLVVDVEPADVATARAQTPLISDLLSAWSDVKGIVSRL